jgi:hypothetical protein
VFPDSCPAESLGVYSTIVSQAFVFLESEFVGCYLQCVLDRISDFYIYASTLLKMLTLSESSYANIVEINPKDVCRSDKEGNKLKQANLTGVFIRQDSGRNGPWLFAGPYEANRLLYS